VFGVSAYMKINQNQKRCVGKNIMVGKKMTITMWYRNIALFKAKDRTIGLFEIYPSKKVMLSQKGVNGYSVRFKTNNTKMRKFTTQFYETEGKDWDAIDENYGTKYWDFQYKENALEKIKELGGIAQ